MHGPAGASRPGTGTGLTTAAQLQATNVAVTGPLRPLLPEGVAPGSTVAVAGSVGLALALAASLAGSERWVAGIGWGPFGLVAAHELGLSWDRLVLADPGSPASWTAAVAAALDAFDIVVVRSPDRVSERDVRRLAARARERRSLLVATGTAHKPGAGWPVADVRLRVAGRTWEGLGDGHGYLRQRRLVVEATGKGRLARERRLELWLPGPGGRTDSAAALPLAAVPPAGAASPAAGLSPLAAAGGSSMYRPLSIGTGPTSPALYNWEHMFDRVAIRERQGGSLAE